MTESREQRNLTPIEMLQQVSGICKTNGRMNWDKTGQTPEDEFKFLANMIDSFIEENTLEDEKINGKYFKGEKL